MTPETVTITDDRPPAAPTPDAEPAGVDHRLEETVDHDLEREVPLVTETEIAAGIEALGATLHGLAGHPEVPDHWAFTPGEVAQLAPPVTALINRHARARAVARRSPELAVALVMGRWGIRNVRLTAAIRQAEADLAAAEEDTGTDHGPPPPPPG